jgi:hypothetical protein
MAAIRAAAAGAEALVVERRVRLAYYKIGLRRTRSRRDWRGVYDQLLEETRQEEVRIRLLAVKSAFTPARSPAGNARIQRLAIGEHARACSSNAMQPASLLSVRGQPERDAREHVRAWRAMAQELYFRARLGGASTRDRPLPRAPVRTRPPARPPPGAHPRRQRVVSNPKVYG